MEAKTEKKKNRPAVREIRYLLHPDRTVRTLITLRRWFPVSLQPDQRPSGHRLHNDPGPGRDLRHHPRTHQHRLRF